MKKPCPVCGRKVLVMDPNPGNVTPWYAEHFHVKNVKERGKGTVRRRVKCEGSNRWYFPST